MEGIGFCATIFSLVAIGSISLLRICIGSRHPAERMWLDIWHLFSIALIDSACCWSLGGKSGANYMVESTFLICAGLSFQCFGAQLGVDIIALVSFAATTPSITFSYKIEAQFRMSKFTSITPLPMFTRLLQVILADRCRHSWRLSRAQLFTIRASVILMARVSSNTTTGGIEVCIYLVNNWDLLGYEFRDLSKLLAIAFFITSHVLDFDTVRTVVWALSYCQSYQLILWQPGATKMDVNLAVTTFQGWIWNNSHTAYTSWPRFASWSGRDCNDCRTHSFFFSF